jgi:hypothetical protein
VSTAWAYCRMGNSDPSAVIAAKLKATKAGLRAWVRRRPNLSQQETDCRIVINLLDQLRSPESCLQWSEILVPLLSPSLAEPHMRSLCFGSNAVKLGQLLRGIKILATFMLAPINDVVATRFRWLNTMTVSCTTMNRKQQSSTPFMSTCSVVHTQPAGLSISRIYTAMTIRALITWLLLLTGGNPTSSLANAWRC